MTGSTNNTWGLGFSETFDVFGSTANNDPSFYVAIPNRYFEGVQGLRRPCTAGGGPGYQSSAAFYAVHHTTPYIRQVDVHGGYTAAAGHYLYTARSFPKAYWNRIAFITEPTAHLVGQGVMEKQGAGFVARDGWNLLAGAEEWVAPVHAQVGPDGAVWVADWYNFITQHNPTPMGFSNGPGNAYETSLRDKRADASIASSTKDATPGKTRVAVEDGSGRACSRRSPPTTCCGVCTPSACWSSADRRTSCRSWSRWRATRRLTRWASTAARFTRCGRCTVSASSATPATDGYRAAVDALKHPAAGRAQSGRDGAAEGRRPRPPPSSRPALLADPDLHTRLAAVLAWRTCHRHRRSAQALYRERASRRTSAKGGWAARSTSPPHRHQEEFLAAYKSDKAAVPFAALPVPLRLGNTEAGLARARGSGARGRLEGYSGPGRVGDARAARLRRCRVVHADARAAKAAAARRPCRSVGSATTPRSGSTACRCRSRPRRARRRRRQVAARRTPLLPAGGTVRPGPNTDHGSDSERPRRRRFHRRAGPDVRRGSPGRARGRAIPAAGRRLEIPRRAADKRGRALCQAGRARRPRGVHRGRRRGGGGGDAAAGCRRRPPTS